MVRINCCAKCGNLSVIQINSKQCFFCQSKGREITYDDLPDCKNFVYQDHKELDEQSKKDFELLYNLPDKKDT